MKRTLSVLSGLCRSAWRLRRRLPDGGPQSCRAGSVATAPVGPTVSPRVYLFRALRKPPTPRSSTWHRRKQPAAAAVRAQPASQAGVGSYQPQGKPVSGSDQGNGWIWSLLERRPTRSKGSRTAYLYTPTYGWTWYASPGAGALTHTARGSRGRPVRFRAWVRRRRLGWRGGGTVAAPASGRDELRGAWWRHFEVAAAVTAVGAPLSGSSFS